MYRRSYCYGLPQKTTRALRLLRSVCRGLRGGVVLQGTRCYRHGERPHKKFSFEACTKWPFCKFVGGKTAVYCKPRIEYGMVNARTEQSMLNSPSVAPRRPVLNRVATSASTRPKRDLSDVSMKNSDSTCKMTSIPKLSRVEREGKQPPPCFDNGRSEESGVRHSVNMVLARKCDTTSVLLLYQGPLTRTLSERTPCSQVRLSRRPSGRAPTWTDHHGRDGGDPNVS